MSKLEERKEKILEYINSKEYRLVTVKQLAVLFDVPKDDMKDLEKIITSLEIEGKIYIDESKRICVPNNSSKFVCMYEAKSKGFGFARVLNCDTEDIYISKENINNAFDKDIILVETIKPKEDGRSLEGKVLKIIKRGDTTFVGIVRKCDTFGFVEVMDKTIQDIYIPYKLLMGTENNDRVVVKITKYPTATRKAEGKIVEIIGHETDDNIHEKVIFKSHNIEERFPKTVIEEAEKIAKITEEDLKDRVDLTDKNIYTIDGDDAKDLDDAVCVEKLDDGEFKLSVHIADVSHYVHAGSNIDREAIKRGTSVYTPGKVVPMLPRSLSNGVCSLLEGEKRLTISCDMIINEKGKVTFSTVYKSYIKSKKRMTYAKVEEVLKGENGDRKTLEEYAPFKEDIMNMYELYKVLKTAREKNGSINFDIPETKFVLDENSDVLDVMPYNVGISNGIIEEFMLIANKTIAKTFKDLDAPFIYRIHEVPDLEKLRELNETLKNMGTSIKGINKIHPKALAQVLDYFKETPSKYDIVSKMLLRTLKLAKYSNKPLGHFGLNFKDYTHFTSPIRRYPDLFIHRVISLYLENGYAVEDYEKEKLAKKAEKYALTSSECEKTAQETERDFDDLYMAKYMAKHLGDEYLGTISSVTNFGVYVKLDNTIEGLITMTSLDDDYYIYHEKSMCLIGENTGKKYEVGQRLDVVVARADIETRQIDFVLGGKNGKKTKKK